ncbi:MAG: segregation/condensation protein A [Planctomycetes bacterium]|nr:segregation/condensation protein A [Planctomycetota bacterium]MCP4839538.1 segregation/condensation protein A [Planctomycetota bacterium]
MNAPQPTQKDYRVTLEAFEGPLDLLLFLVRRAEVDLQDIPVGRIADQYLEVLRCTAETDVDVEQAGEFLVMAATLVEIKSRTLTPPESMPDADEGSSDSGDPRDALIRQLLVYQRIRRAAESLDDGRREFGRRAQISVGFQRGQLPVVPDGLELDDVHAMDLAEAYERIASAIDFSRLGDHVVELDDTPIALYEQDLVDRLRRRAGQPLTLQDAFAGQAPVQRVGMFLAVLELVRRFEVQFDQESSGPITLRLRDDQKDVVCEVEIASDEDAAPPQ